MSIAYLYGETRPVNGPIATNQACAVGDLLAMSAGTLIRAEDQSWPSAVATPSAPTVSNAGVNIGTNLTNGATGVKISYNFPWGEGALSNAGSATPTAHAAILLAGQTVPAPAVSVNVYVETSAGSGTYELYAIISAAGGGFGDHLITGYGAGNAPPGSPVTSGALQVAQYNFAKIFAGVSGQTKKTTTFFGGTQAYAYGNSAPNQVRVDCDGIYLVDLTASASLNLGDLIGPYQNASPNGLLSQTCQKVVHESLATFRVVENISSMTQVKARPITRMGGGDIV